MSLLARMWTRQTSYEDLESYHSNKGWPRHCLPDYEAAAILRRMGHIAEILERRGRFTKSAVARGLVDPNPKTKEKIAEWLRNELGRLRVEEQRVGAAPIFAGGMLSRITIADIALTMIQFLEGPPGEALICLLQELLDVDRHRIALVKNRPDSFVLATIEEALSALQGKTLGVRELAKRVSVPPSTITRWRRLDEYRRGVLNVRKEEEAKLAPLVEEILEANPGMRRESAYAEAISTNSRWTSTLPNRRNKVFEAELKEKLARATTSGELNKIYERHLEHRVACYQITISEAARLKHLFDQRAEELEATQTARHPIAHVSE
jgi:hypothetical protein